MFEVTVWATLQGLLYVGIAPMVVGVLRLLKARLQGRQGPLPYQPYIDLLKLFRRSPIVPSSASWVFSIAPWVVFGSYTLLGFITPVVFLSVSNQADTSPLIWPQSDLVLLIYVLGLARFALGLAGMDTGASFGGLGSGREMFIHVLAEPTLILVTFALALNAHTTALSSIMWHHLELGPLGLLVNPAMWTTLLALLLVMLAETGRLPFDNPATHLELTMVGKAIHLEYAGSQLALLEWAEAIRLTFFLTLLLNLFFPYLMASPETGLAVNVVLVLLYPLKLFVLILLLAIWEMMRARLRLRALVEPAGMALVFSMISVVVIVLSRYLL